MKLYVLNPPGHPGQMETTWSTCAPGEDEYAALIWEHSFARDDHGVLPPGLGYTGPFDYTIERASRSAQPVYVISVRCTKLSATV